MILSVENYKAFWIIWSCVAFGILTMCFAFILKALLDIKQLLIRRLYARG
jgi:hypothetical protein